MMVTEDGVADAQKDDNDDNLTWIGDDESVPHPWFSNWLHLEWHRERWLHDYTHAHINDKFVKNDLDCTWIANVKGGSTLTQLHIWYYWWSSLSSFNNDDTILIILMITIFTIFIFWYFSNLMKWKSVCNESLLQGAIWKTIKQWVCLILWISKRGG